MMYFAKCYINFTVVLAVSVVNLSFFTQIQFRDAEFETF